MFRNLIYRDPSTEGGGAAAPAAPASAPAAASAAPAQPAMAGPASYGGSSSMRDWEDPYKDPKFIAQFNTQPPAAPADGNKTPSAPGTPGIGEGVGNAAPTAGQPDPNASTTAPDGQAQPPAGTGALSPEDKTYWTTKDPALKDLPDHPAVAKVSKMYRDLEATYSRGQEHVKLVNQNLEDFKAIVQSGDPAEIAKMVEHFGGEVQFEARKPENVITEMKAPYQEILAALKSVEAQLPAEAIPAINRALEVYASQVNARIADFQGKQERKAEIRKEIARLTGVQTPTIGNPYERYKEPAKANMNTLDRELQSKGDTNFWKYYEAIRPLFQEGGVFHAQGITVGKAFGASSESARHYMNLAKGIWLTQNMDKEVVPNLEKNWLAKQKGNGAVTPPPAGNGATGAAPRQQDPMIAKMERDMEQHMNRRRPIGA